MNKKCKQQSVQEERLTHNQNWSEPPEPSMQEWEKEWKERFCKDHTILNDQDQIDFIRQEIAKAKDTIIGEFITGKRCLSCGGYKESENSDWCDKCYKEN